MTTHYLDLDFADSANTNAGDYNLNVEVRMFAGPAGGNSVIRLIGTYTDLEAYVWHEYTADAEDAEFVCSLIEELQEA